MKLITGILSFLLVFGLVNAEAQDLKTDKERLSYSMGVATATQMKRQSIDIDVDMVAKGLRDVLSGNKLQMTEQQIQETLAKFQKEMTAKQEEKNKHLAETNKKDGVAFLAKNKDRDGVKALPSGLQYKVITEGKGRKPKESDTISAHYRGTLIDGTEFDSSFKRGQPVTFPVKGVIKGWTEALQLMKEGSKWQLFIPSELAYGERGTGAQIGPNATLIFEVELVSIKDSAEKKEAKEPKTPPKK